jgi:glucosamine--fructose-6-phosphate aminotransferase (isomerizing)
LTSALNQQSVAAASFLKSTWPAAKRDAHALGFDGAEFKQVLLCGCGDSHHAAYSLGFAFRAWSVQSARGLSAMELSRYVLPEFKNTNEQKLLVGISVSGETARTLEAIELGKAAGVRTLAITSTEVSSLAGVADATLTYALPSFEPVPGLLSYLASLLMGYAMACVFATDELEEQVDQAIKAIPGMLSAIHQPHRELGVEFAERIDPAQPIIFLGSGPAYGSAMFAAAKTIEAAGQAAWAQDVEEWAHLEYFIEQAESPVWMLRANGRAASREQEVLDAARALGRDLVVSELQEHTRWGELLAPLSQWVGPVSFADSLMNRLGESPFRGFTGGRSRAEGGGASRIRSSRRLQSLPDSRHDSAGN